MLKQQVADFKLVFILMEIINFEATWILNAIKIECSIVEVRFYDAYYIKIIFSSLKSKSSVPACSENIQSFITGVLFDM
jgi:hypothetical protein